MDLCVCVCVRTHVVRYILYSTYYIELGFFTLLSHRFILMLLFSFFRCHYIILHNGKMRQKTGKSSQVKGKYEKKRGNVCVCVWVYWPKVLGSAEDSAQKLRYLYVANQTVPLFKLSCRSAAISCDANADNSCKAKQQQQQQWNHQLLLLRQDKLDCERGR